MQFDRALSQLEFHLQWSTSDAVRRATSELINSFHRAQEIAQTLRSASPDPKLDRMESPHQQLTEEVDELLASTLRILERILVSVEQDVGIFETIGDFLCVEMSKYSKAAYAFGCGPLLLLKCSQRLVTVQASSQSRILDTPDSKSLNRVMDCIKRSLEFYGHITERTSIGAASHSFHLRGVFLALGSIYQELLNDRILPFTYILEPALEDGLREAIGEVADGSEDDDSDVSGGFSFGEKDQLAAFAIQTADLSLLALRFRSWQSAERLHYASSQALQKLYRNGDKHSVRPELTNIMIALIRGELEVKRGNKMEAARWLQIARDLANESGSLDKVLLLDLTPEAVKKFRTELGAP